MSGTVLVGSFERDDFALQGMELRREYYVVRETRCGEDVTCYIVGQKVPKARVPAPLRESETVNPILLGQGLT
jgi:hypothetical protein